MDACIERITADPGNPSLGLPYLRTKDKDCLFAVAEDIIRVYMDPYYQDKYGHDTNDDDLALLAMPHSRQVPSYFANSTSETIYRRKALTILGLRNLILMGELIFDEMQHCHFSSRQADYGHHQGPSKMRFYTGNVVDLDTVLVRCTDRSLLSGAFGKVFQSQQDLSGSKEVEDYVKSVAQERIAEFRKTFKMDSDDQAKLRRIFLTPADLSGAIHVAQDNTDRGEHALWHYVNPNAGQDSYHVNVPEISDVVGALLRSPFGMLKAWATLVATGADLEPFFEDCLADSCFNGKWKAIEAFCAGLTSKAKNGIYTVLCKLQQDNQHLFPASISDDDEIRVMVGIIDSQALKGEDSTGSSRLITRDDVVKWQRIAGSGVMEDF